MELHDLGSAPGARKTRKRVGRGPGSGWGKTCGKGSKGARMRSGFQHRAYFEGGQMPLHRRLPKRGFHHDNRWPMSIVNLDRLAEAFEAGAAVTSEDIVNKGLARAAAGGIKVLGRGEIAKALTLNVEAISPSAQAKVEAAGGAVQLRPRKSETENANKE